MHRSSLSILVVGACVLASCAAPLDSEDRSATITNFDECVAAGYPILEIYPEQCRTTNGEIFVREVDTTVRPDSSAASSVHAVSIASLLQKDFQGSDVQLGAVQAENAAYTRYTITYQSGDVRISGILNIPKGDGPFPLIVFNHGYIDPAVYTNGRGLKREQDYLARRGYAVLHTDYRNHAFSDDDPDTELHFRMGYVEDSLNAILAVRASDLSQIDTERVGMLGHSMGGGVTLSALIARPDLIDAAVFFAPVSGDARLNYRRWTENNSPRAAAIVEQYGSPEDNPDFWEGLSALNYVDRIRAPVMIHHGTADDSVPVEWSEDLDKRLQAAGKDTTLHIYQNEPHEFIADWELVMQRTTEFFVRHL